MNPIFYLLLIAISGGVLAIGLAVALVIFIVGFAGVAGDGGSAVFAMEEGFNCSKVSGC